jgi:hypothetical protein
MARFHTTTMLPMRSELPCQLSALSTRARACASPAAVSQPQGRRWQRRRIGMQFAFSKCVARDIALAGIMH